MAYIEYNGFELIADQHNALLNSIGSQISPDSSSHTIAEVAVAEISSLYGINQPSTTVLM